MYICALHTSYKHVRDMGKFCVGWGDDGLGRDGEEYWATNSSKFLH